MSLSGLPGLATNTNTAYEISKGREQQGISGYESIFQGQPPPQPQNGEGGYEIPSLREEFPAVPAIPPPAVAPSQDGEDVIQEEAVYELIPEK